MRRKPAHGLWLIAITFFFAFYMAAVPLPGQFEIARPDWVGMLIIYWALIIPERFGILISFAIGLLYDTLVGTTLGVYGLVFSFLAYLILLFHDRIRLYPLGQQALVVFLILGITHILGQWVKGWLSISISGELHIWPALSSAIMWPWVYGLISALKIKFRVQ